MTGKEAKAYLDMMAGMLIVASANDPRLNLFTDNFRYAVTYAKDAIDLMEDKDLKIQGGNNDK